MKANEETLELQLLVIQLHPGYSHYGTTNHIDRPHSQASSLQREMYSSILEVGVHVYM